VAAHHFVHHIWANKLDDGRTNERLLIEAYLAELAPGLKEED
jgi:hypothetical protein